MTRTAGDQAAALRRHAERTRRRFDVALQRRACKALTLVATLAPALHAGFLMPVKMGADAPQYRCGVVSLTREVHVMHRSRSLVLAALVATAATGVLAQPPGKGPGPQAGPAAAASGPAASAPGPGAGPRARWGSDYTPGWSMMTAQERNEHRARLRSMQSYDECVAYMAQHREQMAARAKEQGRRALGTPPRDPCAPLKR